MIDRLFFSMLVVIQLSTLFHAFLNLCLLRLKPQDIPASRVVWVFTLLLSLATGWLGELFLHGLSKASLSYHLLDSLLITGLLTTGLYFTGRSARFLQSSTAIFASHLLMNLLVLPLLLILGGEPESDGLVVLVLLAYFLFIPWALMIIGHVLRYTFDLSMGVSLLLSVTYFLFFVWLVEGLFA